MDENFIVTLLGTVFGLIGIIIAAYRNNQRKRIEEMIRVNNWYNYEQAIILHEKLQHLLQIYKEKHTNNIDIELFEELSKADVLGQESYIKIIRQIQMFEPSFSNQDIEKWFSYGKIDENRKKLFRKYIVDPVKEKNRILNKFFNAASISNKTSNDTRTL